VILAQAVAEAQLVQAVLDRGEVAREPGTQGIEIHHHEHAVDVGIGAERVDRQAERGVVDNTAIPMRHAVDLGPRKSRRQAAARQHVARFDLRRGHLSERLVDERPQRAGHDLDRGHRERRRAGVERREIHMAPERHQQRARIIDISPGRSGPEIRPGHIEARQSEIGEVALRGVGPERRRFQRQIVPQRVEARARVGIALRADHAGGVDGPDRDSGHDLERDSAALRFELVHQLEQRVQGAAFIGSERPAALQNHAHFNQLVRRRRHV
jgi:hypothetical protein